MTTDTNDLAAAIQEFEAALPDWWWSVRHRSLSRDASCGPDIRILSRDHPHAVAFDAGFHADLRDGTLADALRDVMRQALEAIACG